MSRYSYWYTTPWQLLVPTLPRYSYWYLQPRDSYWYTVPWQLLVYYPVPVIGTLPRDSYWYITTWQLLVHYRVTVIGKLTSDSYWWLVQLYRQSVCHMGIVKFFMSSGFTIVLYICMCLTDLKRPIFWCLVQKMPNGCQIYCQLKHKFLLFILHVNATFLLLFICTFFSFSKFRTNHDTFIKEGRTNQGGMWNTNLGFLQFYCSAY